MNRNCRIHSFTKPILSKYSSSGDWFVCTSCGYLVRIRVLGDTAHCSQCGGTMRRK